MEMSATARCSAVMLGLLATLVVDADGSCQCNASSLKICVLVPPSHLDATVVPAVERAQQHIMNDGSFGRKIEVLTLNTQESIPVAVATTNFNLATCACSAILGPSYSTVSMEVARIADLAGFNQISFGATSPGLSDKVKFPRFFRVVPSAVQFAQSVSAMLASFPTWKEVALVVQGDAYGLAARNALVEALTARNISVQQEISVKGSEDAYPTAKALKKSRLRLFVTFLYQDVLHNLLSQATAVGITSPNHVWVGGDDTSTGPFFDFIKSSSALDLFQTLNLIVVDFPAAADFGVPNSTYYAARAYDAAFVFARAFDSLSDADAASACLPSPSDGNKLAAAIRGVRLEGRGGPVAFDADGEFALTVTFDVALLSGSPRSCQLAGHLAAPCSHRLGSASREGSAMLASPAIWADGTQVAPSGSLSTQPTSSCENAPKRSGIKVRVVMHGEASSGFWNNPNSGVVKGLLAAVSDSRADVIFADDVWLQGSAANMVAYMQSWLATDTPDVLVTSIPDAGVMKAVIEEAAQRGVLVYGVNAGLDVAVGRSAWGGSRNPVIKAFFGNDELEGGYVGARLLVEGGATQGILFINHEPANSAVRARGEGAAKFVEERAGGGEQLEFRMLCLGGGCESYAMCQGATCSAGGAAQCRCVVESRPWSELQPTQQLRSLVAAMLDADGSGLDAVLTGGADQVEESLMAIEQAQAGDVKIGTFDLTPSSFAAIEAGSMLFALHQDQFMQGYMPIIVGTMAITKQQTPSLRHFKTGPVVISARNLQTFRCFIDEDFCKTGQAAGERVEEEEVARLAVVTHGSKADTFWDQVLEGINQAVTDTGIEMDQSKFYSEDDCSNMIAQYQQVLEAGRVDALLTTFQCMSLREPLIEIAKTYQIPIILFNSGSREAVDVLHGYEDAGIADLFVHYIGQDDFLAGQQVGERMLAEGAEHVLIFLGSYALVKSNTDRYNGIKSVLEGRIPYSTIAVVEDLKQPVSNPDMLLIQQVLSAELQRSHRINAIMWLVQGGRPSAGILATKQLIRPVRFYTFDTNTEIFDLIYGGDMAGTVFQGPYFQGYLSTILMVAYLRVRSRLPQFSIWTGPVIIDETNVDQNIVAGQISGCLASICPPGTFLEGLECTACPAGTFQPTGKAMHVSDCLPCPRGTQQPETGVGSADKCVPCLPGTFAAHGAGQCAACSENSFCPLAAASNAFSTRDAMHVLFEPSEDDDDDWDPIVVLWVGLGLAGGVWVVGFGLLFGCSTVGPIGKEVNKALLWLSRRDDFGLEELDEDGSGTVSVEELMGKGMSREKAEAVMRKYDTNQNGELDGSELADFNKPKVAAGILCFGLLIGALSYLLWFIVSWIVGRVEFEALIPIADGEPQSWPPLPMTIRVVLIGAVQTYNKQDGLFECKSVGLQVTTTPREEFRDVAVTRQSANNHSCEVIWSTSDFTKYPEVRIRVHVDTAPQPEFLNAISWQILMPKYDRVDSGREEMRIAANKSVIAAEGAVFRGERPARLNFNLFLAEYSDVVQGKANRGAVLQPLSQSEGEEAQCAPELASDDAEMRAQKRERCHAEFQRREDASLEISFSWSVLKLVKSKDRQSNVLSLIAEGGGNLGLFINSPPTLMGIFGYFFAAAVAWCGARLGKGSSSSTERESGEEGWSGGNAGRGEKRSAPREERRPEAVPVQSSAIANGAHTPAPEASPAVPLRTPLPAPMPLGLTPPPQPYHSGAVPFPNYNAPYRV